MNSLKGNLAPYLRRLVIIFVVSILGVGVISETAFRLQKHNIDRGAQEIELLIPLGTAEKVAAGQPVPAIPAELVFVVGDVLVVRNQDVVTHELGPMLVPPNSSASMPMNEVDSFALNCSFQPSNYLGLDITEPTTWQTRLLAIAFAAPPTAVMVFLYSLVVRPVLTPNDREE